MPGATAVAHELAHQWWYGLVGTNEFEDAWMDEGINQYANARVMAEAFTEGREVPRFSTTPTAGAEIVTPGRR